MTSGSWLPVAEDSDFQPQNLPYGIYSRENEPCRAGTAIGSFVLDLAAALDDPVFAQPTLNAFLARGRATWQVTRSHLTELLTDPRHEARVRPYLIPLEQVRMHLPIEVADYVDFYSSEHHASNIGKIFRPDGPALTPNWKHLPIGYHGRSGTIVVSGTDIIRPCGQHKLAGDQRPAFGPSQRLDIEAEIGFIVGTPSPLGTPVPASAFADHVFGAVLVNDWSARDIQAWESTPLGPFLGKSFATSVSPWVVPLDALASARLRPTAQHPEPLPYLRDDAGWGLDIDLEISWNGTVVSRPPFREMYWTAAQQLAHLTVNGASLRTGDLFASGTVSGPRRDQRGCLLELTWNGTEPIELAEGAVRTFLEDGDAVSIRATAPGADGIRIGFGELTGRVLTGVSCPPKAGDPPT